MHERRMVLRRCGVQRLLLIVVLVDGDWTQIELELLGALVGQIALTLDAIHTGLDAKDEVQERLHQDTQQHKAQEAKDDG